MGIVGKDWKKFACSSGVELLYGPFPYGLYWDLMAEAKKQHPDPEPPKKTIDVFDGTEEVDDLEDPEHKRLMAAASLKRWNMLGEASLDLCVEVKGGIEQWEPAVKKMEKYVGPAPEDPEELKLWFVSKFALRTKSDWDLLVLIQRYVGIEDEEVAERADFFRGDVEGQEGDDPEAPGPDEE